MPEEELEELVLLSERGVPKQLVRVNDTQRAPMRSQGVLTSSLLRIDLSRKGFARKPLHPVESEFLKDHPHTARRVRDADIGKIS